MLQDDADNVAVLADVASEQEQNLLDKLEEGLNRARFEVYVIAMTIPHFTPARALCAQHAHRKVCRTCLMISTYLRRIKLRRLYKLFWFTLFLVRVDRFLRQLDTIVADHDYLPSIGVSAYFILCLP